MDFMELIRKRYSVRKFDSRQVETEKLLAILDAGRLAPTACNYQPYKILALETPTEIEKLRKGNPCIYESPVALIVCADHEHTWKRLADGHDYADIDATIVTDHMMLAAAGLELGSVWIGAFDPENLRAEFKIPPQFEPVNILLIGYPAGEIGAQTRPDKRRKPLEETVVYGTF
jgi:nitroreductase